MIWGVIVFSTYALRLILQKLFNDRHVKRALPFNPRNWENIFIIGTLLGGSVWGIAGSLLLPHGEITHHVFLAFLLAGSTAGAGIAYCSSIKSIQAFILPSILPFALKLAIEGTPFQYGMALMLCVYIGSFSILMKKMNKYIVDSIRFRFENDHLLRKLSEAQSRITHAAKMTALGEMAGGISHEINNPLMVIQGSIQNLHHIADNRELNKEEILSATSRIGDMAHRMAKIVSGLRTFAREDDKEPVELVSIEKLVSDTLNFCRARFQNSGIQLTVNEMPKDLMVECRGSQIMQVLFNLLNNAFDAVKAHSKSWVRIEVQQDGINSVTISVTDSGSGIPEDIRDKIMQPFFTSKDVGLGIGLGLSISKGIVEDHFGTLALDTSSDATRFVVTLPLLSHLAKNTA
jgi:signal transduction histidine kinase